MFHRLTELTDDLEDALRLAQLALAAENEDDDEDGPEASPTLQALGNRVFTGLQRLPEGEPGARPGVGYVTALHLNLRGKPYPRTLLEVDQAISRCVAHPRGGLLVVGRPGQPLNPAAAQMFLTDRVATRVGADALLEVRQQTTAQEGPAVVLLLRHVPTHRPPDPYDAKTVEASCVPLSRDQDVQKYVFQRSPPSLSVRDTLYEYGLLDRETQTESDRPTLAAQIAFAPRPRLPGLAFLVQVGNRAHLVGDRPLRDLCDEVIRILTQADPSVDGDFLRHVLLYAIVHRSWASQTIQMGVSLLPDRISLIFPGETRPGWVRNEFLLALVRRNLALGWKDDIVETARRFPAGSVGAVTMQFHAPDTFLTLTLREPRREPAAASTPRPKAQDVRAPGPARPPVPTTPTPARTAPTGTTPPRPTPARTSPPPTLPPAPAAPAMDVVSRPHRPPASVAPPTRPPVVVPPGPDLRAFLADVCILDPDALLDNPVLYERFIDWTTSQGANTTPSQRWLAMRMKDLGFRQAPGRTNGVRRWQGLRLRP